MEVRKAAGEAFVRAEWLFLLFVLVMKNRRLLDGQFCCEGPRVEVQA